MFNRLSLTVGSGNRAPPLHDQVDLVTDPDVLWQEAEPCDYSTDVFHSVHLDFLKGSAHNRRCTNSRLKPFIKLGDDLESFYWVFLWTMLRYTDTTCHHPSINIELACERLFQTRRPWLSRCTKDFWLQCHLSIRVSEYAPLTALLEGFTRLCSAAVVRYGDRVPLDHEPVLALFSRALEDTPDDG